jgi:hypothetical protein
MELSELSLLPFHLIKSKALHIIGKDDFLLSSTWYDVHVHVVFERKKPDPLD